jgi:hypothetical protein
MGRSKARFYAARPRLSSAEARPPDLDLRGAAELAGLADEAVLLRALVRQAVQRGQGDEARRLVLALCGVLRLQRALAGEAERPAELEALLETVGQEREQAAEVGS